VKKGFFILVGIIFVVSMAIVLSACDFVIDISNIELISDIEEDVYEIGKFCYDNYYLEITYTDKTSKIICVDESMISEYDRMQLNNVGTHTISINYDRFTLPLDVTITYKPLENDESQQIVRPYIAPIDVVYDGNPHVAKVEGDVPENAQIIFANDKKSFVNAGYYEVTATIIAEGYETIVLTSSVVIRKANYDLSGISFTVNYGVDKYGNALESFIYDGKDHSAELVGEIPLGLSEPTYLVGERSKPISSYEEGRSAKDAGRYTIIARFTGDSENYNVDNLELRTELIIDKKPITQEGIGSDIFVDKTETYNGQRFYIKIDESVKLPDGVGVNYYYEDGRKFDGAVEANEEGYLVEAKFVSSDSNYDITNSLWARLYIRKATYKILPGELTVSFENGKSEVEYDGTPHQVVVNGLVDGISVKRLTINGEYTSEKTEAGVYNIFVEFNSLGDNYISLDPLEQDLTIEKINFATLNYGFSDLNVVYDGLGHSLVYNSYSMSVGVDVSFTYQTDKDFTIYSGIPTDQKAVGTYTCIGHFSFNRDNYYDAPEVVNDISATLTITTRSYNAKENITVSTIKTTYSPGKNNIELCTFSGVYPDKDQGDWNFSYKLVVYGTDGVSTTNVTDSGIYKYKYVFRYFNGVSYVEAETDLATLKVIGRTFTTEQYVLSVPQTGVYDGNKSYLPTLSFVDSTLENTDYTLTYKFKRFDSDEEIVVDQADYVETSKNAGTHTFIYAINAKNYEPDKRTITTVVDRQTKTVNHYYYSISNYTGIYDGEKHDDQIEVMVHSDDDIVKVQPLLISSSNENSVAGKDVGIYEYTIDFISLDPNVKLVKDAFYNYNYTVTINSREIDSSSNIMGFSLDASAESEDVTISKEELFYDELKVFTSSSANYITSSYLGYSGTYTLSGYTLRLIELEDEIANDALENNISYILYDKNKEEVNTYDNIQDVIDNIQNAGIYLLLLQFNNKNIICNGLPGFLYKLNILSQPISLNNPEKVTGEEKTTLPIDSETSFTMANEGILTITGDYVDEIKAFNGSVMYSFATVFFSNKIIIDAEKFLSPEIAEDASIQFRLVKLSPDGEIIKDATTFDSIFTMANGDYLFNQDHLFTDSGVYYVFIDLGTNYIYQGSRRIVYKVNISGKSISIIDIINIKNSDNTIVTPEIDESEYREYITEKSKFKCALENNSSISGADAVKNAEGYEGKKVYTYSLDFYDDFYYLSFFDGEFTQADLSSIDMNIIFASYSVTDGGKTIHALSTQTYINKSHITVAELDSALSELRLSSQNEFTPVGIYYLFVTMESNLFTVNGDIQFVVCIQVNRSTNASYYSYSYGGRTYSYLTDGLKKPFAINFTDNVYTYSLANLQSQLPLADHITSYTCDDFTMDDTSNVTTWFSTNFTSNNLTIVFDTEKYGGYSLSLATAPVSLKYNKKTINLDTAFTAKYDITKYDDGTTITYTGKILPYSKWQGQIYKYYEDHMKSLGVDSHLSNYFANNYIKSVRQVINHTIEDNSLDLIIGITTSYPTDDQIAIRNFITSLFEFTYGGTLYKQYYTNTQAYRLVSTATAGITVKVAKRAIYITKPQVNTAVFTGLDYINNNTNDYLIENLPIFKGYLNDNKDKIQEYTTEDNLFLSGFVEDTYNKITYATFMSDCVSFTNIEIMGPMHQMDVTVTLAQKYSKYYVFYERTVDKDFTTELSVNQITTFSMTGIRIVQ